MPLAKLNESYEFSGDEICSYGCNQKANYAFLNGKFCCERSQSNCLAIKEKNSISGKNSYKSGYRKPQEVSEAGRKAQGWNRGLTKETSEIVAQYGRTYSERIKSGKFAPSMLGRKHSIETRSKISENATGWINGGRTHWYEIFCPYTNCSVKVQGGLELRYAEKLNTYVLLGRKINTINFIILQKIK